VDGTAESSVHSTAFCCGASHCHGTQCVVVDATTIVTTSPNIAYRSDLRRVCTQTPTMTGHDNRDHLVVVQVGAASNGTGADHLSLTMSTSSIYDDGTAISRNYHARRETVPCTWIGWQRTTPIPTINTNRPISSRALCLVGPRPSTALSNPDRATFVQFYLDR
jgi:hypothetical protein